VGVDVLGQRLLLQEIHNAAEARRNSAGMTYPKRRPRGPSMQPAPAADRFPRYPASWYLLAPSRDIRATPRTWELLGRRLVAYRTSTGRIALLDAVCSHLGADLGNGCIIGDRLQCPFHHWQYGPDGRCLHIPAQEDIPLAARQTSYPVAERRGLV